jgi:hypothetical protein
MDPELVFLVCNNGVLPAWVLLAVAPHWVWTQRIVHAVWIPAVLGIAYAAAFATSPGMPEGAGFGSLPGVMLAFSVPHFALAGWIHYLAFDLFVGAWEVRDARRNGIHHLWVVPCLLLTLMLGPIGLLLYVVVRFVAKRTTTLVEPVAA